MEPVDGGTPRRPVAGTHQPSPTLPVDPDIPRRQRGVHPFAPRVVLAVLVGGGIGTWGRYALEQAWPPGAGGFPWATLAINTSGAFLLGLFLTLALERVPRLQALRPLIGTGLLGGWTTMSTMAVETDGLLGTAHTATALAYIGVSLVAAVGAIVAGVALGRVGQGRRSGDATTSGARSFSRTEG